MLRFPGAFAQKTLDFAVSFFVLVVIMTKKVFFAQMRLEIVAHVFKKVSSLEKCLIFFEKQMLEYKLEILPVALYITP